MAKQIVYLTTNTLEPVPVTTLQFNNGRWIVKTYPTPGAMRGDIRRGFFLQNGRYCGR
jgi:hypothetical protein